MKGDFEVRVLEQSIQDEHLSCHQYLVTLSDGTNFTCKKLNYRPDSIYFSEDIQSSIDSNLLNEIETFILGFEGVR